MTTLSDEAVASQVLCCSGLPTREQTQVVSHAGGVLASELVEPMLKSMYGRHHEGERKLGLAWKPGLRPRQQQRS